MDKIDKIMIDQGYLIDTALLEIQFLTITLNIDLSDFALVIKPYLTHVNNSALNRLYYKLFITDAGNISDIYDDIYWVVRECQSNDRLYKLVKELIRRFS